MLIDHDPRDGEGVQSCVGPRGGHDEPYVTTGRATVYHPGSALYLVVVASL